MSLYQAQEQAAYRQAELLEEAAARRLARMARGDNDDSIGDRQSDARLVALMVAIAIVVLGATAVVSGFDPGAALAAAARSGAFG